MSIFFNIYTNESSLTFIKEIKLTELDIFIKHNSYTKVISNNESTIKYNTSIYVSVLKKLEIDKYKEELLKLSKILIDHNRSFLLVFNGELPLVFNKSNSPIFNNIDYFSFNAYEKIGMGEIIKQDLSKLFFEME